MKENGPVYLLMILFALIVSFIFGCIVNTSQWQKDAIKAGVAEWIADENGDAEIIVSGAVMTAEDAYESWKHYSKETK